MQRARLRALSREEVGSLERLAHSRTAPVRTVERAQIVWRAHLGQDTAEIAAGTRLGPATVRAWLKRFNSRGLAGLADLPRSGSPVRYTDDEIALVRQVAARAPPELGLPFTRWSLTRLQSYLNEHSGITIRRSRISEVLKYTPDAEHPPGLVASKQASTVSPARRASPAFRGDGAPPAARPKR